MTGSLRGRRHSRSASPVPQVRRRLRSPPRVRACTPTDRRAQIDSEDDFTELSESDKENELIAVPRILFQDEHQRTPMDVETTDEPEYEPADLLPERPADFVPNAFGTRVYLVLDGRRPGIYARR